ncbi:transglutaminase family protein [Jiulongibacter sediminis]|uniref:IMP dehydrogenase n=1 Tax=Jiulongibacter sediminis TaxID=1605367 RepID=A0A0P7B8P4_9BACT|nr:transglutaminase family protein [Jiulongibacter sediminis]KPM46665.1 IMP dehydrogenase [Jiulongibacter sediminis]TBX21571.1 IMP dehydrogenase [Jiulongibacter sediminis]
MSIRVAIRHKMHYDYDRMINVSPQVIRLKPAVHSRTPIQSYSLKISPENHFINWQQDPFGNFQARVVFPEKIKHLHVDVEVIADLKVINPFDFFVDEYAEQFPFKYEAALQKELQPYFEINEDGSLLKDFLETQVPREPTQIVDFLVHVNQALYKRVNYTIRMEPGVQTCEETLGKALGSCRDSSWVLVQAFRHLGLAARFISGYLVQLTADEKSLDGPSGPEADFTDLHAWCEVFVPGAGWIGLDPTSGLFAGEGHIPLSCTPSPGSAAPITGMIDKCETKFDFANDVFRIHEEPRVTKPYNDEEWQNILKVGVAVEADLVANDVRLTMGGEPTFVSIDDMEAAEWNTAADGPHKRRLAKELTFRIRESFAPNGMLHFGQGKLYPGEALPRWQYGCLWRKDGKPIWKNSELIASPAKKGNYTENDASDFLKEVANTLRIDDSAVIPAYEDSFYFAWEENKLPVDRDPLKLNLKDAIERRTLTEVLSDGLGKPKGYVLPVRYSRKEDCWESCKWPFRRKHLFLLPGNSSIGFRLPLNSLPESILEQDYFPRDPFAPLPDLEDFEAKLNSLPEILKNPTDKACFKTALSVEVVEGRLHLFLPPHELQEHYLEMVAAIHMVSEKTKTPVVLEGYEPPSEGKLNKLFVTPDPGVIEVNVHPSASWDELVNTTLKLYEQAKQSRLGTEKFMIDGRHTGTGGGNHITIGGFTPADSPLLRRPKLLQSLITYWQHHPSLSYLFSGPFVGPTSQAPRVDEGRDDVLYELEIAFFQVPKNENPPLWIADRLFRNLLIDVTGNTHRAELCIDKLYSPYGTAGRQGILEFRGFDMPPHAQMSLAQNLLIRALVSRFWKTPYEKRLVRWGTELHDRFMLEHYVRQDINEIVAELQETGYAFEKSWFDAFIEFRFPVLGKTQLGDMTLELRWAIEPWNVLGEEVTSTGTARYVDSSVERVQLKINGWNDDRYIMACNEVKIPMKATGKAGQYVAGIRYKAWAPPSALHPTVGVDTPLTFDVIDTWNNKSIGGFTYHVAHPGGRNYETLPVNSMEAEARRHTRFFSEGHTQGNVKTVQEYTAIGRFFEEKHDSRIVNVPVEEKSSSLANTLDLRTAKRPS